MWKKIIQTLDVFVTGLFVIQRNISLAFLAISRAVLITFSMRLFFSSSIIILSKLSSSFTFLFMLLEWLDTSMVSIVSIRLFKATMISFNSLSNVWLSVFSKRIKIDIVWINVSVWSRKSKSFLFELFRPDEEDDEIDDVKKAVLVAFSSIWVEFISDFSLPFYC